MMVFCTAGFFSLITTGTPETDVPSFLVAILLGLLQGLTEFLPISSSGHLVLAQALLKMPEQGIIMEIILHGGTLLAVLLTYWRDLLGIVTDLLARLRGLPARETEALSGANLLLKLLLATIPVVVVGLLWRESIESAFESPRIASICLIGTGILLLSTRFARATNRDFTYRNAGAMGVMQVLSLLPGISRSGSTICGGLFTGARAKEVVRFSFLMSVPAILGSIVLELPVIAELFRTGNLWPYFAGFICSFLSGLLAIQILLRIVSSGRFFLFGIYCLLVGIISCFVI